MLWEWDAFGSGRYYSLGMDALGMGCSREWTLSWFGRWMLWEWDALGNGCDNGLGMDALVMGCCRTWSLLWFALVMVWYAFKHGRCSGLGMDAMLIVCFRTWKLFWFGHKSSVSLHLERYKRFCLRDTPCVIAWGAQCTKWTLQTHNRAEARPCLLVTHGVIA